MHLAQSGQNIQVPVVIKSHTRWETTNKQGQQGKINNKVSINTILSECKHLCVHQSTMYKHCNYKQVIPIWDSIEVKVRVMLKQTSILPKSFNEACISNAMNMNTVFELRQPEFNQGQCSRSCDAGRTRNSSHPFGTLPIQPGNVYCSTHGSRHTSMLVSFYCNYRNT